MKTIIISPHTDDAIFSLGSFIASGRLGETVIVSPFAGIPTDAAGKKKHTTLRAEHLQACKLLGCDVINGDFFDDVYGKQDIQALLVWFTEVIKKVDKFDNLLIPLGIHHPDHILVRDLIIEHFPYHGYYWELPYRVLYPDLAAEMSVRFARGCEMLTQEDLPKKREATLLYRSQVGAHMHSQLFVVEGIWRNHESL